MKKRMPKSFRKLWENRVSERTVEYKWVWEQLPDPPARILDVGPVENTLPIELAKVGFDVVGIDIRDYPHTHKRFTFVKGDVLDHEDLDRFDVTIAVSTLEHLGKDVYGQTRFYGNGFYYGLRAMWRLTKPGGVMLVTMPYGIQKWGHYWINFPTKIDLDRIKEEYKNVQFFFYEQGVKRWRKTSQAKAALRENLQPRGYPQAAVFIRIDKDVERQEG